MNQQGIKSFQTSAQKIDSYFLDALTSAILLIDESGLIVKANKKAKQVCRDSLPGKSFRDLSVFSDAVKDKLTEILSSVSVQKKTHFKRFCEPGLCVTPVNFCFSGLCDQNGKLHSILVEGKCYDTLKEDDAEITASLFESF